MKLIDGINKIAKMPAKGCNDHIEERPRRNKKG